MKIIFLGTNGWYDTKLGSTICTIIDSEEGYIILDAGDGIHKIKKYITKDKPVYLFLSHLHLDHISGFHIFPSLKVGKNWNIILEKGNKELLERVVRHPYMIPFGEEITFHEVEEGDHNEPLNFKCLRMKHIDPSFGYRIRLEGKNIAYCLDTGLCENVIKLADKADILITEGSMISGTSNQEWGHLNPEEAAGMARDAQVKKMVITHLSAYGYKNSNERREVEKRVQDIFKDSLIADDDLIIEI